MASGKVWLWWSSGKDSAWSLHSLNQQSGLEVTALVTTLNQAFDRVAMHGVRAELLRAQAAAAGVSLVEVPLPWPCSNDDYEAAARGVLQQASEQGVTHMAFGDLFLEDVRDYRLALLDGSGIEPLFPLWGQETRALAEEMVQADLGAWLTCVDPKVLPAEFAGRAFDRALLDELPASIDPCGENGEFHTFVWKGPMFSSPLAVSVGERVERDGFVFCDLAPAP